MKKEERMISSDFGRMLKLYRTKQNLSFHELSKLSGVSSSYLFRLENSEKRSPSYKIIVSICKALSINVDDLIAVMDDSSKKELKPIGFLIITNEFTINGKKASKMQKEKIVKIIELIFNSDFIINSDTNIRFEDFFKSLLLVISNRDVGDQH